MYIGYNSTLVHSSYAEPWKCRTTLSDLAIGGGDGKGGIAPEEFEVIVRIVQEFPENPIGSQ